MWRPIIWCWFLFLAPIIIIIGEFILAIKSVLKFKHWYLCEILNMGDGDGLKCWYSHRKWKQQLARWTQIADLQKCVIKKSLWTKKLWCMCPKMEYFGIYVPFCYYSLLGRVIDFPSRVRVVKKIPSTGRVASTRHSLIMAETQITGCEVNSSFSKVFPQYF